MMANNAASPGAQNAVMSRNMPGDATDRGPLQAARRVGRNATPPAASEKARAVGNNLNFIRVSSGHALTAPLTNNTGQTIRFYLSVHIRGCGFGDRRTGRCPIRMSGVPF